MGFLDALRKETAPPANPANAANVGGDSPAPAAEIRKIRGIRSGGDAGKQSSRLRWLATVAGCPTVHIDRLHPAELAEYAHYPDADAVASLRHLAACRDCQRWQCRPVTCATCARYLPNPMNPEAGMGQCGGQYARAGVVLSFPHAPRHCQGWRAAA